MSVQLEIKGLNKLVSMADKYPAVAEKYINKAISRSLARILGAEKKEAPFGVSGQLRDRWDLKVGRFQGSLRSGVSYSMAVHDGTRPHFVSVESIRAWANKKGLNPYAVAKSIGKKGTRANPFFQRALNNVSRDVDKEFEDALTDITKDIVK